MRGRRELRSRGGSNGGWKFRSRSEESNSLKKHLTKPSGFDGFCFLTPSLPDPPVMSTTNRLDHCLPIDNEPAYPFVPPAI
ncbi:hypothetical protein DPEC_G00112610 [Dallia pectoralis]|uniref:Uncharacterized protein n=1 Tax=Dallia pectoralis TaxID=75939 RepID=A0ACC2GT88_DALPE|nr:hypothetical protein DPEC_G00112610 [Dallia pectoralis]